MGHIVGFEVDRELELRQLLPSTTVLTTMLDPVREIVITDLVVEALHGILRA
jgi:hypothetical protein